MEVSRLMQLDYPNIYEIPGICNRSNTVKSNIDFFPVAQPNAIRAG